MELRTLGIAFPGEGEKYLGNTLLSFLIRSKLPHFFLVELSRKTDRPFPSFRQFITFGDGLICRLQPIHKASPQNSLPPPPPAARAPKPVSAPRTLISGRFSSSKDRGEAAGSRTSHASVRKVAPKCKFCGDSEHSSLRCTKVVSYTARVERARKRGLCFRCLSSGHGGEACPGVGVSWVKRASSVEVGHMLPHFVTRLALNSVRQSSCPLRHRLLYQLLPSLLNLCQLNNQFYVWWYGWGYWLKIVCFKDVNFLIDTGFQISLIDSSFLTRIHKKPKINLRVSSIGSKLKLQNFLPQWSNLFCLTNF